MNSFLAILIAIFVADPRLAAQESETLPPLIDGQSPRSFDAMWNGFDPRAEPLEIEVLHEWEEEEVILRVVRFRIGVFKGRKATLAAIYGYPRNAAEKQTRMPGLLQLHGGGQYADYRACLQNAKRGYATLSIAWAGRINAPGYQVTPAEVELFWESATENDRYKLTTDWGAVDGYHAPARNPGNVFPSARPHAWTIDEIESPRNSGWFLCALAARRALTFLEQQPEIDPDRLGVYGHSMGGKLTVMASVDSRVVAAAPSCGGISDRHNVSEVFRETLGDDVSLSQVSCPILFLSPANDFHGRIGDLPAAIDEIQSDDWRVTCAPHHNHQDTPPYEVATMLWFDQHLKESFRFPHTPVADLQLVTEDGIPQFTLRPDRSRPILAVEVYYSQQGQANETPVDRENTIHRFWHHAEAVENSDVWSAKLPLSSTENSLWVYANVIYSLDAPATGAGYYYGTYTARSFNLSSLLITATPDELVTAEVETTLASSLLIEDFGPDWENEWFSYRPDEWARTTNKLNDPIWRAPDDAMLCLDVQSALPNTLVVMLDDFAAEFDLVGGDRSQEIVLAPSDFRDFHGDPLESWKGLRQLRLCPSERLRPPRGSAEPPRIVGAPWEGAAPRFENLRWNATVDSDDENAACLTSDRRWTDDGMSGHSQTRIANNARE